MALAEPNLEKRSKLAMDNAEATYQAARTAYGAGEETRAGEATHEVQEISRVGLRFPGEDRQRSAKKSKMV